MKTKYLMAFQDAVESINSRLQVKGYLKLSAIEKLLASELAQFPADDELNRSMVELMIAFGQACNMNNGKENQVRGLEYYTKAKKYLAKITNIPNEYTFENIHDSLFPTMEIGSIINSPQDAVKNYPSKDYPYLLLKYDNVLQTLRCIKDNPDEDGVFLQIYDERQRLSCIICINSLKKFSKWDAIDECQLNLQNLKTIKLFLKPEDLHYAYQLIKSAENLFEQLPESSKSQKLNPLPNMIEDFSWVIQKAISQATSDNMYREIILCAFNFTRICMGSTSINTIKNISTFANFAVDSFSKIKTIAPNDKKKMAIIYLEKAHWNTTLINHRNPQTRNRAPENCALNLINCYLTFNLYNISKEYQDLHDEIILSIKMAFFPDQILLRKLSTRCDINWLPEEKNKFDRLVRFINKTPHVEEMKEKSQTNLENNQLIKIIEDFQKNIAKIQERINSLSQNNNAEKRPPNTLSC